MLGARVGDVPHTGSPSLSVCCLTRGPTNRVAAQLRLLRDVADEIVVGLDTSVDAELAHPLEDVADVLVHYPYVDPVDRPVGWIHSLCTRDWILWVDDDEIPSARLVASVRETIADPSVTHCFVPRRTLWGDAGRILAGTPWVPDFQLRLVQNDPRLVWFPGITHWPIQAIGPHRYLDAPLYHTDLLLNPLERRRAEGPPLRGRDPRAARRRPADERRLLPSRGPRRGAREPTCPRRTATRCASCSSSTRGPIRDPLRRRSAWRPARRSTCTGTARPRRTTSTGARWSSWTTSSRSPSARSAASSSG